MRTKKAKNGVEHLKNKFLFQNSFFQEKISREKNCFIRKAALAKGEEGGVVQ